MTGEINVETTMDNSKQFFLEAMQDLVLGSELNNTYKMALLLAIADCALALPIGRLDISYLQLAESFLRLYWPHTQPFVADRRDLAFPLKGYLKQGVNHGPLKILTLITKFKQENGGAALSFEAARKRPAFLVLVRQCARDVVRKNPLTYLKNADFLYSLDDQCKCIVLTPTAAENLRIFHPLVTELAQMRWEAHVRQLAGNAELLGESRVATLRNYLFYPGRNENLRQIRQTLKTVTSTKHCFYCGARLQSDADVDHFLPYARFRPLRVHNFVLACSHCNRSKGDSLAASEYLSRWLERNRRYGDALQIQAEVAGISADRGFVERIAKTLYKRALMAGESFWLRAGTVKNQPQLVRYLSTAQCRGILELFDG